MTRGELMTVRTGWLYCVFFTWSGRERLGRAKSGVAALFCEIFSTRGAGSQTRAAIALPARRWSHVTSEHIVRPAKNLDICSDPIDGAYRQWSKVLRASKHLGHGICGTGAEVLAPLVLRDKSI